MNIKQFDKLYLGKAVHCKTEELANEFLEFADSVRYRWFSGTSLLNTNNWEDYKNETCYLVRDNPLNKECIITYCDITHYDVSGIEIIDFKSLKENKQLSQEILANNQTMFELRCDIKRLKQKILNQKIEINDLKAELYDIYKNR